MKALNADVCTRPGWTGCHTALQCDCTLEKSWIYEVQHSVLVAGLISTCQPVIGHDLGFVDFASVLMVLLYCKTSGCFKITHYFVSGTLPMLRLIQ